MYTKKPDWLKIKIQSGGNQVRELLKDYSLNTVCNEAGCPNQMECFKNHTATFMILGKNCTRNCTFCKVTKDKPEPVNPEEPHNIAKAVDILNLNHVVITSVTRDDLKDGGSSQFVKVIEEITKLNKDISIEVLIPDFKGDFEALKSVVNAKPEIINHNVETVPSLYKGVRPLAVYERSLEVLENVKKLDPSIYTKSGFMLGLGEKKEDVISLMKDLRNVDCDFLTIGQYLAPSTKHHKVIEYVHPDVFKEYEEIGLDLGFKSVFSGPLVRSSYRASECFSKVK